jgi:hypothetical protein
MDTRTPAPTIEPGPVAPARSSRITRVLLGVALAAFALPFLTVTCTSEPTTVSGIQAATTIDVYPNDSLGEREVDRDEPSNAFAFAGLVGAIAALAMAFRKADGRAAVVWFSAAGGILLWGFFLYAFFRTIGNVVPGLGLVAAIALLMAASWTAVETVPRWVVVVGAATAVGLVAGAFAGTDPDEWNAWLFLGFYAGGITAVLLSVGAVRASVRGEAAATRPPSTGRIVIAGIAGVALVAAIAFGGPWLAGALLSSTEDGVNSVASSLVATAVLLGLYVAASVGALVAGSAIVHGRGRRRAPRAPMQQVRA